MPGSSRPYDPNLKTAYRSDPSLLCVNFNQDYSCMSVGTRSGYSITNCEPFGRVYGRADGAVGIVEMLFCTSLVALVGTGDRPSHSTRRLQIVNTKRQSTICELTFPTSVLAVKLNRKSLVVVLEEQIYVYDISNMKLLQTIETSPNPGAICALAPSSENGYLAFPSPVQSTSFSNSPPSTIPATSVTSGDVLLYDAHTLSVTNIIQAHKTPLAIISFNSTGTLMATASDKGTVIRVFSIPEGQKILQFRRGSYSARIFSISFNAVSSLLAVSSDTDTVHIFKLVSRSSNGKSNEVARRPGSSYRSISTGDLSDITGREDDEASVSSSVVGRYQRPGIDGSNGSQLSGYEAYIDQKRGSSNSFGGSLRKKSFNLGKSLAGAAGGYLPQTLTELWDPQRDFAFLKLPCSGIRTVVAISSNTPQVMVISSEGLFYCYNIDLENGGECILQKSHNLLEGFESLESSSDQNNSSNRNIYGGSDD
ncbi:WD40-repeat-containing domain protein [Phakopsora pachyrhizi]|uniref:Autophagy-related protein 18 n=1 Tax=Phakopsora pachyrhizi TaxID=170000 RepID=A0AAV0ALR2_PHAPC|nr:WD40-repeat-containing domain protein [Phakopsora pachyrhizi]CAH7669696.1 WD40-repeat-containing domain protein [Phakopsora pachyrhizi]